MAITNTTLASPTYNGNGTTTAFATVFQFLDEADLKVVVTSSAGVETTKVLTTDYTVTGAGDSGGGTVTFVTAPATGEKINITSNVTLDQQTDYTEGGSFSANTHETALDKLTKISQQIKEITDRSVKLPISNQDISTEVSLPVANYVLRVNSDASSLEWASGASIGLTGAVTVTDNAFTITDDGDSTKKLSFEVSGVSTATTRTLTIQDLNGTVYVTGGQDVSVADGGTGASTASGARTNLGLGTLATQNATSVSITGGSISGITDLALADGGTGASLSDPGADRIMFWDDSAGAVTWLTPGTNLTITGTTLNATSGSGGNTWSDPVDADIVPDADGTRDLGTALKRFAETHTDSLDIAGTTTVTSILDEDNMASNSATALATQQSIKAYVDASAGGGSWVKISSSSASTSASISFTGLTSTYRAYKVILENIVPATAATVLYLRTSSNGGTSYDSTAGDYGYYTYAINFGGVGISSSATSSTKIDITTNTSGSGVGTGSSLGISGEIMLISHSNTTSNKMIFWRAGYTYSIPSGTHIRGVASRYSTSAIDAIQFLMSSGNITSGTFTLYGLTA